MGKSTWDRPLLKGMKMCALFPPYTCPPNELIDSVCTCYSPLLKAMKMCALFFLSFFFLVTKNISLPMNWYKIDSICSVYPIFTICRQYLLLRFEHFHEYLIQHSLKSGGTKYHFRQIKVPDTTPHWKTWKGVSEGPGSSLS